MTAEHPTRDRLAAFDAGLLRPAEHAAVEAHVAACPTCCRVLETLPEDDLAARIRRYSGEPDGVPPDLQDHPRYRVQGVLGAGGMGAVYRAVQVQLDRVVAVKVLHRRMTDRPGFADRFAREVKALARLHHPNIVTAFDADHAGDTHFFVMEYVPGESLEAEVRRRGPLPVAEACDAARQAAEALAHAFEHGIVHRDIKPGNLLRGPGGVVKVADFGLARVVGSEPQPAGSAPPVLGTPEYMAPEQARDPAAADHRADLYSLGCTLYFLLTGRPPFSGPSPLQTLLAHQDTAPTPVRELRPDVPPSVAAVLDGLMAKDPDRRFQTPAAAAAALAREGRVVEAPPRSKWKAGVLVTAALAGAAGLVAVAAREREQHQQFPTGSFNLHSPPVDPPPPDPGPEVAPVPRLVDLAVRERRRLATPDEVLARKREQADRMIDWVREKNRRGRDAPMVVESAREVAERLPKADGVCLRFGGELVQSGRPTVLVARAGGFHAFTLTDDDAGSLNLGARSRVVVTLLPFRDLRRAVPNADLTDLRVDDADGFVPGSPVTGTVRYRFARQPAAGEHLRLSYYLPGGKRVLLHFFPEPLPDGDAGVLTFRGPRLDGSGFGKERVVVLFAEWVSRDGERDVVEGVAAAALVRFRAGD
jgi:hypothetical protein